MSKYILTDETTYWNGHTLHRIKAIKDFADVKTGDIGGWVQSENNLSQEGECWIADNAKVFGNAEVFGNARVYGGAEVYNYASVYGGAIVYNYARVFSSAKVYGDARVYDNSSVFSSAGVYSSARVYGNAEVRGNSIITSNIITATRSDGYTFTLLPSQDGIYRISAGCRYFTFEEAYEHWTKTRKDTKLGDETFAILRLFEVAKKSS
jgi:hypothetical protein